MRSESQLVASGFGWRQVQGRRQACSRSVPCCPILISRCSAVGAPWECNHLSVSASRGELESIERRSEGEGKGVGGSGGSR